MIKVQYGLTLIELLIGLVVMAVLTTLAIPGFQSLGDQYTVRSAGMAIYADLQLARSEAIKRNREVTLCFTNSGAANWSYALHDSNDCTGDIIEIVSSQHYPAIIVESNVGSAMTFKPRRNTFFAGNIAVKKGDYVMKTVISNYGGIRSCSDNGLLGVPLCS